MSWLPDELACSILNKLPMKERVKAEAVCKQWRRLASCCGSQPPLVLHIEDETKCTAENDRFPHFSLSQLQEQYQTWEYIHVNIGEAVLLLERYCLGSSLCLSSRNLQHILFLLKLVGQKWPNLSQLEVEHLWHRDVFILKKLARLNSIPSHLSRLQTASNLTTYRPQYLQLTSFSQLTSLELVGPVGEIKDLLVKSLPASITKLWIPRATFIQHYHLQSLVKRFGQSMQHLCLGSLSPRGIELVAEGFPNLEVLDLVIPNWVSLSSALVCLSRLKRLKGLGIRTASSMLQADEHESLEQRLFENYVCVPAEQPMQQPAAQSLFSDDDDDDESEDSQDPYYRNELAFLFENRVRLEHVALCCDFEPTQTLRSLSASCPYLKTLRLTCATLKPSACRALLKLRLLRLLEVQVTQTNYELLAHFIRNSNSVVNYSLSCKGALLSHSSTIFQALNSKANANPEKEYCLNVRLDDYQCQIPSSLEPNIRFFPKQFRKHIHLSSREKESFDENFDSIC